jgi:hypothetical protein
MPEDQADSRTVNFAGDVDDRGRPLPMTVEVLGARTQKWPRSPHTPDGVAAHLSRARQMFIDGYYTYENFIDGATRSLQAVEAGFRVRLEAGSKASRSTGRRNRASSTTPCMTSSTPAVFSGTSRSTRPRPPSTTRRSPP